MSTIGRRLRRAAGSLLLLVVVAAPGRAQEREAARDSVPDPRGLPREVSTQVIDLFNAPSTLRSTGQLDIAAGREVRGDVAVLNGPLTIGGRVTGRVVAINSDVVLQPGARLDADLLVVGGKVEGAESAAIVGDIRIYRQPLHYRHKGDRIVADRRDDDDDRWFRHFRREGASYSAIRVTSSHTYNRVEGFPILAGPRVRRVLPGGARFSADVFGIFRTSDQIEWTDENLGYSAWTEVRGAGRMGVAVGARAFDTVDPVERWQLTDLEVGLGAFMLTRDYRDYYGRHGGEAYARLFPGRPLSFEGSVSDERWRDRRDRDPFTLFRGSKAWRPNPLMDEGRMHLARMRLRYDTRNNRADPRSGWHVTAEYERGTGVLDRLAPTSDGLRAAYDSSVRYGRGFADVRRYNRISPDAQVNLRLVAGGWLDGDPLPLQRRMSVSGPGALAGYSFRSTTSGTDVLQCASGRAVAGVPAECERMILAQVEYRGDLDIDLGWNEYDSGGFGGSWVLFLDSGRGWMVGPRSGSQRYERGDLPELRTWRSDIGFGFDFDPVGLYVAKAVGGGTRLPPNFFIRLTKRL